LLRVDLRTEVVAYAHEKLAITRALEGREDVYVETTLGDEDTDGYVVLQLRSWHVLPAGTRTRRVRSAQRHFDRWAADIAETLPSL
jgi:hypothetical protein